MSKGTVIRTLLLSTVTIWITVAVINHFKDLSNVKNKKETGSSEKININDETAIKNFLQGRWSYENYANPVNAIARFRFEISGNELKIWSCSNNTDDPFEMNTKPEILAFTLGSPTRDIDGNRCRYLRVDDGNLSLNFRGQINSIWINFYDFDGPPIIKCSGGTNWRNGWK